MVGLMDYAKRVSHSLVGRAITLGLAGWMAFGGMPGWNKTENAVLAQTAPLETILVQEGTNATPTANNQAPVIQDRYFTDHPAYVMQGVTDLEQIFALPINGVPELNTGAMGSDPDGDTITWTVETSSPAIQAFFQNDMLYIEGKDAKFSGNGSVTVRLRDPSGLEDSVVVPVVVFKTDKTFVNEAGKKEYYVPHNPSMDINRINSVENFLREYGYEEERLDRSINFSRYLLQEYMKSVTFLENWINEEVIGPAWSWESTKMLIDSRLDELVADGVEWIFWRDLLFMAEKYSNAVVRIYGFNEINAGSLRQSTPEIGLAYLVNQAHNKGLKVGLGLFVADIKFSRGDISPRSWSSWFDSYEMNTVDEAETAAQLGVDVFVVGESLVNISGTITSEQWGDYFTKVITECRKKFFGPVAYLDTLFNRNGVYNIQDWSKIPIFSKVDYISANPYFIGMVGYKNITVSALIEKICTYIDTYVNPLVEQYNKPLIFFENGITSSKDAIFLFGQIISGLSPGEIDFGQQAIWYEAVSEAMSRYDWFYGLGWFAPSFLSSGGIYDNGFSFRNKPAESIIREYFGSGQLSDKVVILDGNINEWESEDIILRDNLKDNSDNRGDLIQVSSKRDSINTYFLIELSGGLREGERDNLSILFDKDGNNREDISCGVFWGGNGWMGTVSNPTWNQIFEFLGVAANSTNSIFEISVPNRVLPSSSNIRVKVYLGNGNGLLDQTDGYYPLR